MKTMNEIYKPIVAKIDSWLMYYAAMPRGDYRENRKAYDEHRRKYDLDCILTGGDLNADTIFSLWSPLKKVLYEMANKGKGIYDILEQKPGTTIYKNSKTLKKIRENIEKLLPEDEEETLLLSELFALGQETCNVMILPNRRINCMRGNRPYNDYMPYFLSECFRDGAFSSFFEDDEALKNWIYREKLEVFFENEKIARETVKDLAGSGDVRDCQPKDICTYLTSYIEILKQRKLESFFELDLRVAKLQEDIRNGNISDEIRNEMAAKEEILAMSKILELEGKLD